MKIKAFTLALTVGIFVVACATSRDAVLSRVSSGLEAAQKAFIQADVRNQEAIVAKATSLEEGKKALAAYRDKRDKVAGAFVLAWSAVAAASLDLTEKSFVEAVGAAGAAYRAWKELSP